MPDAEAVYQQYRDRVYGYLFRMCRNHDLAEELTQETFYQAMKQWNRFDAQNQQMTAVKSVVPEWQPWDGGSIKVLDQETFEIMLARLENTGFPIDRSKIHSLKPAAVPAPEQ